MEKVPNLGEAIPDINMQLNIIADELFELKTLGKVTEEEIIEFNRKRDVIEAIEDEESTRMERGVLLRLYRDLVKTRRGLQE